MKKKVLSALLAVALFVGLAVPAFASDTSTQQGDPSKVTAMSFAESTYELNQDSSKDFDGELRVFETNKKLVLDHNQIVWELKDPNGYFSLNGSTVTAVDTKGSATLVARDGETGKVTAKTTLKIVKSSVRGYASSYKFAAANYKLPIAQPASADGKVAAVNSEDVVLKIVPVPAGTIITKENAEKINTALEAAFAASTNIAKERITFLDPDDLKQDWDDNGSVVIKIDGANALGNLTFADDAAYDKNISFTVKSTFTDKNDKNPKTVTAKTNLIPVKARNYSTIGVASSKTIEVGETFKLGDTLKWGATNANVGKDDTIEWYERGLTDTSEVEDYAIVSDKGVVTGVAVGKNKIVAYSDELDKEAVCIVTVVARGTKTDDGSTTLSSDTATIEVGGDAYITIKNADADAEYTWKANNDNVTIVAGNNAVKIFGKKVGTATVTCYADGIEIASVAVTVKAATTTEPTKPGATTNPQTGDSIFAGLF